MAGELPVDVSDRVTPWLHLGKHYNARRVMKLAMPDGCSGLKEMLIPMPKSTGL